MRGLAGGSSAPDLRCVHAVFGYQQAIEDPQERERFSPLLQPMMTCLASTLNRGAEANAQEALAMFIEGESLHSPAVVTKLSPAATVCVSAQLPPLMCAEPQS